MVKKAVIRQLSFQQTYDDDFLSQVLDTERCLIILDGLDEWSHPKNRFCENLSSEHIPHRAARGKSIYLTLTRPWKLNQICLKDSEKDVLLEIGGVSNQDELITNVITSLNKKEKKSRDVDKFKTASKHLSSLVSIPVICVQLVCIWHESEKIPNSQCDTYCTMIKMLLERKNAHIFSGKRVLAVDMPKCFHSMKWLESEIRILEHLGKLAFETLFPEDGKLSHVVFNDVTASCHLEDEIKMKALSVGLLTEYKLRFLNQKRSQLSFLHKTFQEFLAAFYLSLNIVQNKELILRIKIRGENVNDITQFFIILCGIAPTLATSVSEVLMAATTHQLKKKRDVYSGRNILQNITELLNTGYTECVQNGHDSVCLQMTHIYFGSNFSGNKVYQLEEELIEHNVKKIETLWCEDRNLYQKALSILYSISETITTLCLPYVDNSVHFNMCHCLQTVIIPFIVRTSACLDMTSCHHLEYLYIKQHSLTVNINTDQLHYCELSWCDLSQGNIVETLTKRNRKLGHLTLVQCTFPRANRGESISFHLDLASCSSLQKLKISSPSDDKISVSLNTTNLQECKLWYIDLSQGNLLEALVNSTKLTLLDLLWCCFSKTVKRKTKKVCIDISNCTKMSYILVLGSDVIVKYNNLFLGRERIVWVK